VSDLPWRRPILPIGRRAASLLAAGVDECMTKYDKHSTKPLFFQMIALDLACYWQ
jgi:hypothetical protein